MGMDTCRTCLATDVVLKPIHRKLIVSNEYVRLSDILDSLYGCQVKEDDGLPQLICNDCTYQLTIAYSFKYLIEASATTLIKKLTNIEISNNSDHDNDNMLLQEVKKEKMPVSNENTHCYCTKCPKEFESYLELYKHCVAEHQTEITDGRPCDCCNERFPDFPSFIQHRMQHKSRHICSKCWKMFDSQDAMDVHDCNDKDKGDQKYLKQCDQCGKSYKRGYFRLHTALHGNDYKFSCKYCPLKFKVACGLNSHVLWKHKRTRNHPCTFCEAKFITASARSAHTRKCHLKEKSRICESCGKSFYEKRGLERHMLTHTGERKFKCQICFKAFQTTSSLNLHLKIHNRRQSEALNNANNLES